MLKQPHLKYRAFAPIELPDRRWPSVQITKAPLWLSTDLRDGNQALIEPMDPERKLRMFQMLVRIGFKEIEVGFPSASQTDFDFVRLLIEQGHIPDDVTIQVLTQARQPLIERTFESLKGAKRAVVHLYNAVAPVMRRVVLGMDEDQIVDLAVTHTRMIRDLVAAHPETEFGYEYSPEMFSNTELAFSKRVVDAVTEAWGATPERKVIINLPTTVENATPNCFADMIEWMVRNIERRDSVILSVHPHNDRGTGTAAAELALMAGADRVEGCLFGNGERTGNLDLVNVALNLYTQGVHPNLDFSDIDDIRRCVEHCNQLPVHPRHPYVGELVYTSFSGSHQDAIKKAFSVRKDGDVWEIPYLPIDPKDLGRSYEAVIRVNSQSGKGGISYLLETEYGIELPRRLQIEFSQIVQQVMDTHGKELGAADLWQIFDREYGVKQAPALQPQIGTTEDGQTQVVAQADLCVRMVKVQGQGKGPIDAFVEGLNRVLQTQVRVLDYHEHALGSGADAQAVAYLELRVGEHTLFGVGMDGNIASASLKAIVSGLRRAAQRGQLKLVRLQAA
ncbi:2-isopropylmalate synthase [Roseateles depolymerans]|uniref:2-isopropylmalate synthase n=1 Tax=Roseateles depolymerans TaxID=76731 RepID=A0A0U3N124_9BURK|nr:2-isopropylmalate synthase [Roseateles depolymerans]ALV05931.1 2-isopropylmalate synthase [Roseateles depolymerans]REG09372.1 2-isopropylmalate synthase [Roseateles depolymerans]